MAAAYVGERAAGGTDSPGTSTNITVASNCTAGNTVILALGGRLEGVLTGATVTDSRGNAWTVDVGPFNAANILTEVASTRQNVATLQSSDTITVTFDATPSALLWWVEEFSGVQTTVGYVDRTASNSGVLGTEEGGDSGTTAATTVAEELAVAVLDSSTNIPLVHDSAWSDFTTGNQASAGFGKEAFAQYKILSATGTQICSMTWPGAPSAYQGAIVTYKAAAAVVYYDLFAITVNL